MRGGGPEFVSGCDHMKDDPNVPVIPLPNLGEGGPVADGGTPVIPLPNPGEGGPVADGGTPVIPLPNPGEGGPVAGGGIFFPIRPQTARVRFLHASYGYPPFRILVNQSRAASWLNYASLSSYSRVPAGYQTV